MSLISERVSTRVEHVVDVLVLPLVERPEALLLQQLGEPDHRVERRAQLVRHVRQELRLVAADRLELLVQAAQLVVHPVQVGRERAELVTVGHRRRGGRSHRRRSPPTAPPSSWMDRRASATRRSRAPAREGCSSRLRRQRGCATTRMRRGSARSACPSVRASWRASRSVNAPRSLSAAIASPRKRLLRALVVPRRSRRASGRGRIRGDGGRA